MNQLDRDINHLEANLKKWKSLYNDEDFARAHRVLRYLKELKATRKTSGRCRFAKL